MTAAGFEKVKIIDEKSFAITMTEPSNPLVKSLIDHFNPSPEQVKNVSESIVSIRVEGEK
jgi:hypothetical protein